MNVDGGRGHAKAAATGLCRVWLYPGGTAASPDGGCTAALRDGPCRAAAVTQMVEAGSGSHRGFDWGGAYATWAAPRPGSRYRSWVSASASAERRRRARQETRENRGIDSMKSEDASVWGLARLAGRCRGATCGRRSSGRGEGDASENLDINPVNRENVALSTQARRAGGCRASTGGRRSPRRDERDECERLDTNPMNRENGVCPAQVGRRTGAVRRRVIGTRMAGTKATNASASTPTL